MKFKFKKDLRTHKVSKSELEKIPLNTEIGSLKIQLSQSKKGEEYYKVCQRKPLRSRWG